MSLARVVIGVLLFACLISEIVLAVVGPLPHPEQRSAPDVRSGFQAINKEFNRLLDNPEIVNVGSAPDAGDGDTLNVALEKVTDNLKRLPSTHNPTNRNP